jgi:hypothetical protein
MYYTPPNSLDFKKGYRLGIAKGRKIERRLCFILVIVFVGVFELVNVLVTKSVCH